MNIQIKIKKFNFIHLYCMQILLQIIKTLYHLKCNFMKHKSTKTKL